MGNKLPTEPELMKNFKVGRSSVREAIKLLVNTGIVRVQQGVGTFVAEASDNNDISIKMRIADRTELEEVRKIIGHAIRRESRGTKNGKGFGTNAIFP